MLTDNLEQQQQTGKHMGSAKVDETIVIFVMEYNNRI